MLLTRDEMSFDFGGVVLDPERDRETIAWMLNQLVYWQVAAVRSSGRLERAPDIGAGRYLADRAGRDLAGVEGLLDALRTVRGQPARAHVVVRRLVDHAAEAVRPEDVYGRLALGEGSLLMGLYALIGLVVQRRLRVRLEEVAARVEDHVDFGERRAMDLAQARPELGRRLLQDALLHLLELRAVARVVPVAGGAGHPVVRQTPAFADRLAGAGELRLLRMGLLPPGFEAFGPVERAAFLAGHLADGAVRGIARLPRMLLPFARRPRRLTDVYLDDPLVRRYRLTVVGGAGSEAA